MAKTDLTKGLLSRYERLEGQRQNWDKRNEKWGQH